MPDMFEACCWPRSRARRIRSSSTGRPRAALVRGPAGRGDPPRDPGHAPPAGAAGARPGARRRGRRVGRALRRRGRPALPRRHRLVGASRGTSSDIPLIRQGGLGIYGAILGGALGAAIGARRAGVAAARDARLHRRRRAAFAQALGRFGNYFNQELFGGPTDLPWGLEIIPANRPAGYLNDATFQPTFLYESLWEPGRAWSSCCASRGAWRRLAAGRCSRCTSRLLARALLRRGPARRPRARDRAAAPQPGRGGRGVRASRWRRSSCSRRRGGPPQPRR